MWHVNINQWYVIYSICFAMDIDLWIIYNDLWPGTFDLWYVTCSKCTLNFDNWIITCNKWAVTYDMCKWTRGYHHRHDLILISKITQMSQPQHSIIILLLWFTTKFLLALLLKIRWSNIHLFHFVQKFLLATIICIFFTRRRINLREAAWNTCPASSRLEALTGMPLEEIQLVLQL